MGNRAVITTQEDFDQHGTGIYLHWNGGRDSVQAFLTYCKLRGFRRPEDDCYGWARLCQVIANFMGGDGLSVGIGPLPQLDCDNYDNGLYLIRDWEIVGRKYIHEGFQEQQEYDLDVFLKTLDKAQPENQQLGEEMIRDLLGNGKTINDIDGMYHFIMKNMEKEGQKALPFKFGSKYKRYKYDTDSIITILGMGDGKLVYRYKDNEECDTSPVFHWKNGMESIIVKADGREYTYNSNMEVSEEVTE